MIVNKAQGLAIYSLVCLLAKFDAVSDIKSFYMTPKLDLSEDLVSVGFE